jgi:hypothetical protein
MNVSLCRKLVRFVHRELVLRAKTPEEHALVRVLEEALHELDRDRGGAHVLRSVDDDSTEDLVELARVASALSPDKRRRLRELLSEEAGRG